VSPAASAAQLRRLGYDRHLATALADLQRSRGNRYVQGVVHALRHDPLVGPPNDRYEREADRMADHVTSPAPLSAAPPLTRGHALIQRSGEDPGGCTGAIDHQARTGARGDGRPLPAPVRIPLQQSLGDDFSGVRVHTDSAADRLARGLGAVAFTTGQDIFFRRGQYRPGAQSGNRLLAHELSHVVQQRGRTAPAIQRKMGLEYETDDIHTRHTLNWGVNPLKTWVPHNAGDVLMTRTDYEITADIATAMIQPRSHIEFRTRAFNETKQAEVGRMLAAVNSMRADIQAIRLATHQHPRQGWGAGNRLVFGGQQGWFARDEWVGLNEIPRLRGPWWQQVTYAGNISKDAVGGLQLTGGFSLTALQRLLSSEQLGSIEEWPEAAKTDPRQYLHGYAREADQAPRLYRVALGAVRTYQLNQGGERGSAGRMAAILSVMAQLPIMHRGVKPEIGTMIAKTNYAKILRMARAEGMQFGYVGLLRALLEVVNAHLAPAAAVNGNSPVVPGAGPPDLSKVSFRQWVKALVPPSGRDRPRPQDLMTRAQYPGTPGEKAALRAFGPYTHADPGRADGERAIFELRSIMNNPSQDLTNLVTALVHLMNALHRNGG
jgi:hypothetical protein